MIEEIIRHELPIQVVEDRGEACYAVVPLHLSVRKLPVVAKVDVNRMEDARETVMRWYNEDMEYYLDVLGSDKNEMHWLEGYERFNLDWRLGFVQGKAGFLTLTWSENGTVHLMKYLRFPMFLYNQVDENGDYYSYMPFRENKEAELIGKQSDDGEIVYFTPEKMLKYGNKSRLAGFHPESGSVEVVSRCLMSDYKDNFAHALLLRNFGVFYLNRLLEFAKGQ